MPQPSHNRSDITNRQDIERLVNQFYDAVKADATIGYFFTEAVAVNWEKHLPVMYAFWENVLFHTGGYSGNPMERHKQLNQQSAIEPAHFQQWLHLFASTVDRLFAGENAETIKQRAASIATVMQLKILHHQ
ncbi:group III truncated hemoglobin [Phnomibacter ginsenosidimutans]|uniref:Hemoglobin-like protein n=1 Tax=Phnomibacter ginsenosidimutans TaxID=2676868 RepID=A0A6I6GK11_9BACT|nr:group III truncated hemoglobin [Phnomibacter ginsenosidimutans]QGW28745.1 hemoglobin-like protein [Phnomibacter ginsenosidimutans]